MTSSKWQAYWRLSRPLSSVASILSMNVAETSKEWWCRHKLTNRIQQTYLETIGWFAVIQWYRQHRCYIIRVYSGGLIQDQLPRHVTTTQTLCSYSSGLTGSFLGCVFQAIFVYEKLQLNFIHIHNYIFWTKMHQNPHAGPQKLNQNHVVLADVLWCCQTRWHHRDPHIFA